MTAKHSNSETAECRLKPDLKRVGTTLSAMKEFFRVRGLPSEVWSALELATSEALNNAIEHGCADRFEADVVCRWRWTEEAIEIQITDPGDYRPPTGAAKLPDDPLAEEGRGLFLIERLVDNVEHTVSSEGHSLRLTKRVGLAHSK